MDEWYSVVRKLKDDSDIPFKAEQIAETIYHDLKRMKIKDKGKFRQRMGPEFDNWIFSLSERFPEPAVKEIISDDDFWTATLKLTLGV